MAAVSLRQSQGLQGAKTIVHRAFEYREEGADKSTEEGKLVAVDVEFREYRTDFDLDDVDILDGESNENFGSGPDIKFLNSDGSLNPDEPHFDNSHQPLRVLLVYAMPKTAKSIKLEYWGDRIASQATPITPGGLRYDESRVIAGVQFRAYPRSSHFGDVWQRGRWLLVGLSVGEGAAVMDLGAWPPAVQHWDCNLLSGVEAAPDRGWVMLTRTGRTREDIRFPVWLHPEDRPGASPLTGAINGPGDHFRGIGVIGERIFAHDDHFLYWLVDGRLQRDETLGEARGVPGQFSPQFTHGTIALAHGRRLLLWDGDGYEIVNGQPKKTWPLGINEAHEFMSVPWGDDGFYFLEDRKVYRVKPAARREQVMSAVENVMGIGGGPEGSIRFHLGTNAEGTIAGLWFPAADAYLTLQAREVSARHSADELGGLYWSQETRHFYLAARDGIFTIPDETVLARPRKKRTPQSN